MNILDILRDTPWWVYVLFIYLIHVGIKALRPQAVSLQRLMMIPVIFLAWSLYSLNKRYNIFISTPIVGFFLSVLALGVVIGWSAFYRGIKVNKSTQLVYLPGSIYPLLLYMAFFILKYCIGFTYALWPHMQANMFFWMTDIISSALISGIFGGRFLRIVQKYQHG